MIYISVKTVAIVCEKRTLHIYWEGIAILLLFRLQIHSGPDPKHSYVNGILCLGSSYVPHYHCETCPVYHLKYTCQKWTSY